jgi:GntR family transcriptional regulator
LPRPFPGASSKELAALHRINPATGARGRLLKRRRSEFADQDVRPLVTEAHEPDISARELDATIQHWEGRR